MPSKVERVRLTPEQIKALSDYADEATNGNKSDTIRLALASLIPEFPVDAPQQGKRTDLEETYLCLWCKKTFKAIAPWECPECGEDEFSIIK